MFSSSVSWVLLCLRSRGKIVYFLLSLRGNILLFFYCRGSNIQFYQTLWPNVCHPKITIYLHFGKEVIVENSHPYKVVFPWIWPLKLGENFISYCLLCCFMVRRCGGVDPPAQSDLAARQTTFDLNLSIIICSLVFLDWLVGIAGWNGRRSFSHLHL